MSTNLALRAAADINEIQQVARLLALSNYFDAKGNSETAIAQLATKILAGQELGYEPFASVNGIHIIQGKPSISGNLMATAVKRSARYDYRVRQMDDSAVTVEFFERINGRLESLGVSAFTAEDAKKAATQNMNKFPRNMLFNRAMSNGVRWYCPDVFSGNAVYVPEEMGMEVDGEGSVVNSTVTVVTPPAPATNGNGKPDADPLETARKAFHAQGTELFGAEWNQARRWMLARYTTKATPDYVREHTGDMTLDELRKLRADMEQYRAGMLKQFAAFKAAQQAELDSISIQNQSIDELAVDAIPL